MNSIFANNIKALLNRYGLSHNDLARLSGVNQPTISRLIKGQTAPRSATVQALAKALKVDPWVLRTKSLIDEETGELAEAQATATSAPSLNSMIASLARGTSMPEERKDVVKPATSAFFIEPDVLLDDTAREQAWRISSENEDGPMLTMYMPTDDLAPIVPRGALLYLSIEHSPDKPHLLEDAPAVGTVTLENDTKALVLGTPSVSLGRITIKTAAGQSVAVDNIVAYVEGWAVFRKHRKPWPPS